jgi:transposase InsO family protein
MIASKTLPEHEESIKQMLQCAREAGIHLKKKKCSFAMNEVKYLGFIVNAEGVKPDLAKTEAIFRLDPPSSVTSLRSFMGMCGYYRHFVKDFAVMAQPLNALMRKDSPWKWGEEEQTAFLELKRSVATATTLALYDPSRPLELQTDASSLAIGAVLQQRDEKGNPKPLAFASRALNPAESRYMTQEIECLAVIFGLQKFRVYLLGNHFTLYTDHQALISVRSKPSPSARITRWSLAMQEYDFEVKHIAGAQLLVPDALSRLESSCIMMSESLSSTDLWLHHQASDDFCCSTRKSIDISPASKKQKMRDGYTVNAKGLLVYRGGEFEDRVVVPRSLVPEVLKEIHDDMMSAHQGESRTISRAEARYFWPGWRDEVKRYVAGCLICQQRKPSTLVQHPALHVVSQGANDLVAMDIQGPLPTTAKGFKKILVIMDLHTRFVVLAPLVAGTTQEVVEALMCKWIGIFGPPARLLTDNGLNFAGQGVDDICAMLKIKKMWTSPYHPQTNGMVERFNRTLNGMLSSYLAARQDDWDSMLSLLAFAYNGTHNPAIGCAPFFLMFGRPAPAVTDALLHSPAPLGSKEGEEAKKAMEAALEAIYKFNVDKLREDSNRPLFELPPIRVGDKVLIYDRVPQPGQKAKYMRHWIGPFIVSRATGPLSFEVVKQDDESVRYRVHRKDIKIPYQGNQAPDHTSWPGSYPPANIKIKTQRSKMALDSKTKRISWEPSSSVKRALKSKVREMKQPPNSEGANVVSENPETSADA